MRRLLLLWFVLAAPCLAQITRDNLAPMLGFENGVPGIWPMGWPPGAGTVIADDQVVHRGRCSARIERTRSSTGTFTTLSISIPLDFRAREIEWRGFLKTENVSGAAALWMSESSPTASLQFASLEGQHIDGTRDWTQYSIRIPIASGGTLVSFGVLLTGTGRMWADDLEVVIDGEPLGIPAVFADDHEFDAGSGISLTSLSPVQIQNLVTLARVWGFLKYHHPAITSGNRHWDYDLFREMPRVLAAEDAASANEQMADWVSSLGAAPDCGPCAVLPETGLYLKPDLDWMDGESLAGSRLNAMLRDIYRNRPTGNRQFYVSLVGTSNPYFDNELPYSGVSFPDAGYQLLALFRYWNLIQYFNPNRDIMADDPGSAPGYWSGVLEEFIPPIALAPDAFNYQQQLLRFIAKVNDTHANFTSQLIVRPPVGACALPVNTRFVEGRPIVTNYASGDGPSSGLMRGDVIEKIAGEAVADLVAQWRPFYSASNDAARMRDMGSNLTRGDCGPVALEIDRGGETLRVTVARVPTSGLSYTANQVHDLPGDTFQLLSPDVAYLKLSSVVAASSGNYVRQAAGTKGLIIDIRNYPSDSVMFSLGQLMVTAPTSFVWFTSEDLANPGAIQWLKTVSITPQQPHYDGKVVILVDETTHSNAEYTTMELRTAPGAIVVGSTTAGADGNVSNFTLPGGVASRFSGLGVYYPDRRPTQRVGIIPDVLVQPTIEGIRAGRDQVLEEAIRQVRR